jgi:F like protein
MIAPPNAPDYGALLEGLLDQGYHEAIAPVAQALFNQTQYGILKTRLDELETEAQRLQASGKMLTPQNPVLRAFRADLNDVLNATAQRMNDASGNVVTSGVNAAGEWVRQTSLPGFADNTLAVLGVQWNRPDPAAVNALVNYTALPAWQDEINAYAPDIDDVVRGIAIRGIADGWNPLRIARELRQTVDGLPAARMNSLMRTLQLQSYRQGTTAHYVANADILEMEAIRIATLDDRTCPFCISQHGQRVPIDTPIDAHFQCRCTTVAVVKGRPRSIQTGIEWFNDLPDREQQDILGAANIAAMKDGAISWSDFRQPYNDPIFGDMVTTASLVGILGDGAKRYYSR